MGRQARQRGRRWRGGDRDQDHTAPGNKPAWHNGLGSRDGSNSRWITAGRSRSGGRRWDARAWLVSSGLPGQEPISVRGKDSVPAPARRAIELILSRYDRFFRPNISNLNRSPEFRVRADKV